MLKSDGKVGMRVMFGRGRGEKTLGKIVKINRKNFKVETLESRGTKRTYKVGTRWTVPPSLCTPVDTLPERRVTASTPKPKRVPRKKASKADWRKSKAKRTANLGSEKLADNCDLSNPPTYIKACRRYLDGTTIRKNGTEYDGQRSKLYKAERGVQVGRKFTTVKQCQDFIDKVLESAWFNRRFTLKPVTVERTQGWTKSYCNQRRRLIRILDAHMNERILLHELVHAIVPDPHAWHGRLFCAIYLDLVRHYIGEDAYDELLAGYRRENVKYQPHRKAKR